MFTPEAQAVIDRAKDVGVTLQEPKLSLKAVAASLVADQRGVHLLAECLGRPASELGKMFPAPAALQRCTSKLPLDDEVREMLAGAKRLVSAVPAPNHAALIALPHLAGATAHAAAAARMNGLQPVDEDRIAQLVANWVAEEGQPPTLGELTRRLRALRQELLARVYGQDHAVHQFVEGLFNVEVVASADAERRRPAGIFVFAGPPGVGKTYLAELGATHLDRPFKRFDMSTYAHGHETTALAGTPRVYQGAQPGTLTDFVQRNPNAVLLFDEIEKAHSAAVQLFLQVLDAGQLQDKFTEQNVQFRDTILIFTTNVGSSLYDNENAAGVHQANAAFHRNTVLDALRSEVDPRTREPFFPAAICSRMATGYPVLFNHLRVEDLSRIARAELSRVGELLQRQHGQQFVVADEIPLALVMREGARTDARTIKAQAEVFLKEEVFKACSLFASERVDQAFSDIREILVGIDAERAGEVAERLFWDRQRPAVLCVAQEGIAEVYAELIPEVEWLRASNPEQVFELLAKQDADFLLLDMAYQPAPKAYRDVQAAFRDVSTAASRRSELHFDYAPPAASRFASGQQLLEQLHTRSPEVPVYLLSVEEPGLCRQAVDEELLMACVRGGGARGAIRTPLGLNQPEDWEAHRDALRKQVEAIAAGLRKERLATELGSRNQVVLFDTAPALRSDGKKMEIRCRNFRQAQAIRSADVGALVSDVERPSTRFDDVIGAAAAKEALLFIRDWLRDPKKYAAAGVEPPQGILLAGPPGTGKTMLVRALAGESDCAFVSEAATNFVTRYQGSGPESIRALFARARRYAPCIVFIDEIEAVGANRAETRVGFVGHGEAMALNQLLIEMDGFSKFSARPVIILAATNHPQKLDPALLRRFSRVIEVELPTRAERALYLQKRLAAKARHEVSPEMVERIAAQGQGLSIADLARVLAQAAVMALGNEGIINDAILAEAFERVTMGEAKKGSDPKRTAWHEAGHALLMAALGQPPIYVTIVGRGDFGGYAAPEATEERRSRTKRELQDLICQLLAGREAERLCYGEQDGDSTGPSNDLERATQIAEAMVYELGMSQEVGFVKVDRQRPLPAGLAERCHAAVRQLLEEQGRRAAGILSAQRAGLERVVAALLDRNRLLKHELLELIAESPEPASAGKSG